MNSEYAPPPGTPSPSRPADARPLSSGFISTPGQPWTPPPPEVLQPCFQQYEILGLLGRGGMGAVYKGWQRSLSRHVAIKVLPPSVDAEDASYTERFKQEARSMARLNHPGIIAVYDAGETPEGLLYIVMEFVEGTDVHQMVSAAGRLPPAHALAVTAHVCDALAYAHEHGIIHRDIKPANIMVDHEGRVKVADFGLAKLSTQDSGLTQTNMAMGTPDYVSPEALMPGMTLDGRADLYAIGVMLYQMLTGKVPRGAFHPASIVVAGLDRRWDGIIQKAMQMDREERHGSARDLRQHLDTLLIPAAAAPALQQYSTGVIAQASPPARSSGKAAPTGRKPGAAPSPQAHRAPTRPPAKKPGAASPPPPAQGKPAWLVPAIAAAVVISGGLLFLTQRPAPPGPKPGPATLGSAPEPPRPVGPRPPSNTSDGPPPKRPDAPPPRLAPVVVIPASTPSFPPGKWVKVLTRADELPSELKMRGGVRFENGWIKFDKPERLYLPETLTKNYGFRARFQRVQDKGTSTFVFRFQPSVHTNGYRLFSSGRGQMGDLIVNGVKDKETFPVVSVPSPWRLDFGKDFTLEAGVVGGLIVARMNGTLVATASDTRFPEGAAYITGAEHVRDIEVVNLEGLSPAEALRVLGVDEKGGNIRPPDPASPPPPFPPGRWVKTFSRPEDMPPETKNPDSKVTWENGAIVMKGDSSLRHPLFPISTNQGVRFKIQAAPGSTSSQVRLRDDGKNPGYFYRLSGLQSGKGLIFGKETRQPDRQLDVTLLQKTDVSDWRAGENDMEIFAVGLRLFARVNGRLVLTQPVDQLSSGHVHFSRFTGSFRDVEFINLDGLPDAEALRLMGVDQNGKDLRAPAPPPPQEQAAPSIPELAALHDQFLKLQAERVTAPFDADLAKLNAGYLGGIDREIANAKTAGHLDGVLALQSEKSLVGAGQPVPKDDAQATDTLKKLRGIYREAYAKIEAQRTASLETLTGPLSNRLQQIESSLTKGDRIADAKAVREYREKLGQPVSAAPAAAPATTPAPLGGLVAAQAPPPPLPEKKYPKGDDRLAAEWVLKMGGTLMVNEGDRARPVRAAAELPKGRFDLLEVMVRLPPDDLLAGPFQGLEPLAGLQKLTRLETAYVPLKDEHLVVLPSLPRLSSINFGNASLTSACSGYLAAMPSLDRLALTNCPNFTDTGLEALTSGKLIFLALNGCGITDAAGPMLRRFKSVKELTLINLPITDALLPAVNDLTGLKMLRILKPGGPSKMDVTPAGLGQLKSLKELSYFAWSFTPGQVAQDVAKVAALFPKITSLDISNQTYSAEDLAALGGIRSLTALWIYGPAIDDNVLPGLLKLDSLESVYLKSGVSFGNQGLAILAQHKKLSQVVCTEAANISDSGLEHLEKMRLLKRLEIQNCPGITAAGIAAFKKARPEVTVTSRF